VPGSSGFAYILSPLTALIAVGVLILLLRWAFSRGGSLVRRTPGPGPQGDYGLLVPVALPGSYIEGELLRHQLEEAGLRATLAQTTDGPAVMVWPQDERAARLVLSQRKNP
jgi:hypothetical protein